MVSEPENLGFCENKSKKKKQMLKIDSGGSCGILQVSLRDLIHIFYVIYAAGDHRTPSELWERAFLIPKPPKSVEIQSQGSDLVQICFLKFEKIFKKMIFCFSLFLSYMMSKVSLKQFRASKSSKMVSFWRISPPKRLYTTISTKTKNHIFRFFSMDFV